jgi:hypothetical protein
MSGADLIRAKHFTYVQVFLHGEDHKHYYGVILEPSLKTARPRVESFIAQSFPDYTPVIHLYPRTYVRDALQRYAEGHVIP